MQEQSYTDTLYKARVRLHLSQQGLADLLGVKPMTVSRWERGVNKPNSRHRERLSEIFGKSQLELALGEEGPNGIILAYSPEQQEDYHSEKEAVRRCHLLHDLGWLAYRRGDYSEAQSLLLQSLALAQSAQQVESLAGIQHILGLIAYAQQQYALASDLFHNGLLYAGKIGDMQHMCLLLLHQGKSSSALGNRMQAQHYFHEGLVLAQRIEQHKTGQKHVHVVSGEREAAIDRVGDGSSQQAQPEVYQRTGSYGNFYIENPSLTTLLLHELSDLWLSMQDSQAALSSLQTTLPILSRGNQYLLACTHFQMAKSSAEQGHVNIAFQLAEMSFATSQFLNDEAMATEVMSWFDSLNR
jgi:transcriptional regulator with XRE-family HTH domain